MVSASQPLACRPQRNEAFWLPQNSKALHVLHVVHEVDASHELPAIEPRLESRDDKDPDPCYAQLLYRCLQEALDHIMTLKNV
jgi:hypothetical protein